MGRSSWRRGRALVIVTAMLAAACGDSGPLPHRPTVTLAPTEVRLAQGSSVDLVATVTDEAGSPMTEPVVWSSSDVAVATVDAQGRIVGVGAGTAQIGATAGGFTATASLTVAPAVRVNVFAASHVLAPGSEAAFRVDVLDLLNEKLVATLTWTSDQPAVASVTADGSVRAAAPGSTTIRADTPGASGTMTIAVHEPVRGRIAFVSERGTPYGPVVPLPDGGIYRMATDGSNPELVFGYARMGCNPDRPGSSPYCPFPLRAPAYDAQGLRIAFVAQVYREIEYPVVSVIYLCSSVTTLCRRLDNPPQTRPPGPNTMLSGVAAPAFSPDGRWLAFVYGSSVIAVWDLATGTARMIDVAAPAAEPAWSPDGQRIAYAAGASGDRAIWVMKADGSERARVSPAGSDDSHPSWSPDGLRIAFARTVGGNSDVYAMNADGSAAVNLSNHPASDRNPAWSPDGRAIAFDTDRDGNREIYVMGADGANPVNLTNHPAPDFSPSWSP